MAPQFPVSAWPRLALGALLGMVSCGAKRPAPVPPGDGPTASLTIERTVMVVDQTLPPGVYEVRLDPKRAVMIISGPVTQTLRALYTGDGQPTLVPRAMLRPYGAGNAAMLIFLEPPRKEWVATKREAPL